MKLTLQAVAASITISSTSAMWGYWVPPLDEPGVSCENRRIKIPGHGEYTCMTVGTGICRDNGGYFGEWRFGIDTVPGNTASCYSDNGSSPQNNMATFPTVIDPGTMLYPITGATYVDANGEVCKDASGNAKRNCNYAGTTHICIGENIETDYSTYSPERPYMFFYNEKTHQFLYQLVCDGAGTEGKLPQLKMVNNEDLATEQYVEYPVDITKFKKGTTADPEDKNELWKVLVDWNGYVPSSNKMKGQLAAFINVAHPYFCTEYVQATPMSCWDNDCSSLTTAPQVQFMDPIDCQD